MTCRRKDVSGVSPSDVTVYAVRCFATLGGASVFVIVVGNYCVAAFYEASGASACRIGFHIPVETSAPPNPAGLQSDCIFLRNKPILVLWQGAIFHKKI